MNAVEVHEHLKRIENSDKLRNASHFVYARTLARLVFKGPFSTRTYALGEEAIPGSKLVPENSYRNEAGVLSRLVETGFAQRHSVSNPAHRRGALMHSFVANEDVAIPLLVAYSKLYVQAAVNALRALHDSKYASIAPAEAEKALSYDALVMYAIANRDQLGNDMPPVEYARKSAELPETSPRYQHELLTGLGSLLMSRDNDGALLPRITDYFFVHPETVDL